MREKIDVLRDVEGQLPGEHAVHGHAEAVDVGPTVDLLAHDLLGGHVLDGPEHVPVGGARLVQRRHAEIEHLDAVRIAGLSQKEKIVRLHVAVDDAGCVRGREPCRCLPREREREVLRHRSFAPQKLAECLAEQRFHHQVRASRRRLADIANLHHIRVVDAPRGIGLAVKALLLLAMLRCGRAQHLHRDGLVRFGILGQIDARSRTLVDVPVDLVARAEHGPDPIRLPRLVGAVRD